MTQRLLKTQAMSARWSDLEQGKYYSTTSGYLYVVKVDPVTPDTVYLEWQYWNPISDGWQSVAGERDTQTIIMDVTGLLLELPDQLCPADPNCKTVRRKSGCECGSEKCNLPFHSDWCPKYIRP